MEAELELHDDKVLQAQKIYFADNKIITGVTSLKIFDISKASVEKEFHLDTKPITSLATSNNRFIASGTLDGQIDVFSKEHEKLSTLSDHYGVIRALKFSQNESTLFSTSDDKFINLTDVETLKRKQTVSGHSDIITSLSVNYTAKSFLSGSLDGTVKVWDLVSGKCTQTLVQKAPVWGVAFSPSGEHLVVAC